MSHPLYAYDRFERLELERIDYRYTQEFSVASRHLRARAKWQEFDGYAREAALRSLEYHVYGRRKSQTVEYPATWWDAVKLRFFPSWALRRWPAQHTKVTVRAEALFPELDGARRQYLVLCVTSSPELEAMPDA